MGLGLTISLLLGTVGFRLPLMLVLSATLTGTAIYQVGPAPVVPFASGSLPPTAKRGTAWAQLSAPKAPTTVLSGCFWTSGELWPTQKRGGVCSHWAHVASERELWTHTNMGLNPCSIIYLLCDPGQVIQHL